MPKCSCPGQSCSCSIVDGVGTSVNGTGTQANPFSIDVDPASLALGSLIQVADSATMDFSKTGTGAAGDPVVVTGSLQPAYTVPLRITARGVSGSSYTFSSTDANTVVLETSSSAAQALTLPTAASAGWVTGDCLEVLRGGTGSVTIVAASGVTIQNPNSTLSLRAQFSSLVLRNRGGDTWVLSGDMQ